MVLHFAWNDFLNEEVVAFKIKSQLDRIHFVFTKSIFAKLFFAPKNALFKFLMQSREFPSK
ncbi:hypothetical protein ACM44_06980 [Chryseobacterium koreense CCUG 49689]|uniref:Uncharacterized protein n=1 Tax=Chryseobacterium koreense CCUG 49689 TaxID=1304281 RepID=A0A0J7IZX3_9FLAO|nr:hypothetical protein ACM44_06980 [Chryseobacterium koreense CCUG 49689]